MIHDSKGLTVLGALSRGATAPGECSDQRRFLSEPHPGFFAFRLVRDGPWCPAVLYRECPMVHPDVYLHPDLWCSHVDRGGPRMRLQARVIDQPHPVDPIWIHGRFIPFWRWRHMMAVFAWAKVHDPQSPQARPGRPVNPRTVRTSLHT